MHLKKIGILAAIIVLFTALSGCLTQTNNEENDGTGQLTDGTTNSDMLDSKGEFEVRTDNVQYFRDSVGFLAVPVQEGSFPGVILVHEWWGLNDNIKDMAGELASHGYNVLAVDLYNGKVATDSAGARELVSGIDQESANANMSAALDYLKNNFNAPKVASLGWCFGGGQSMQLALSGEELDATLIYYGSLVTDRAELERIEWPVLGVFGGEDQSIPVATVNEFDAALDGLSIENEIYVYDGVGHAFANPSGANYAPDETMDAWGKTLDFLEKNLK